jgi:flagellar hook-associated protein 2
MGIQFSGLASGLDTQSIVSDLMKVERLKVQRVESNKILTEWKKEAWASVNAKLYSFYKEELFDFKTNATYAQKKMSSSNTSAVAVNNSSGAVAGTHLIEVTQLAKNSNFTTDKIQLKTGVDGDGKDVFDGDVATTTTTMNELFGLEGERTLTIGDGTNQAEIVIDGTDTIASLISEIKSKGLDLNINYDANYGRIFMSSKSTGAEAQLSVSGSNNDVMRALGFVTDDSLLASIDAGVNAEFSYNGVPLTESSSNEVSINGLSLTLLSEGTSTISVTQDTDAIYNKVKEFVTKYNELMTLMNGKLEADPARGYNPLSSEEKESMTDKEIELWESKIKDSLLRNDNMMGAIRSDMRNTLTLSQGVEVTSKYKYLSDLGIVTGNYLEKGMLHIEGDEENTLYASKTNKLREALENDPEEVSKLLSALGNELYSNMSKRMESSTISSALTFYEDKSMSKRIIDYDKRIASLEDRLARVEERYYKQFTAMEKAMQQSNSTANWLSQQLAGL